MDKKIHQRAHDMVTNAQDTPKRKIPEELKALLEWDKKITKVAFDAFDKRFGYQKYRTQMKWLENSCHGIPWLVASVAMLYLGAWPGGLELWMNLLIYLIVDIIFVEVFLRHISGISEAYLRHISSISQAYLRHISSISQAYLRDISVISE